MPPEMIVNEYTKFEFIKIDYPEIFYVKPHPVDIRMPREDIPLFIEEDRYSAKFYKYGVDKEIAYIVALAPEINTVFVRI